MPCLVRSVYLAQLQGRLGKFLILVHSGRRKKLCLLSATAILKPIQTLAQTTNPTTSVPLTELGKRFTWSWVTDSSEQFDFVVPEGPGECSLSTYKRLHSSHTNLYKEPTPWLEPARHLKIGAPNNCLRNLIMRVFWNPTWTHRAWRA